VKIAPAFIPLEPKVGQKAVVDWRTAQAIIIGLIGFVRRNYPVPLLEAASLEELNQQLLTQCLAYGQHRIQGREGTVQELFEAERAHLLSLPDVLQQPNRSPRARSMPIPR
jgi:hypothetical protein